MNQLTKMFDGYELTVIEEDNEPYFLLKDVCSILEVGHVATVRKRLEDEVVSNHRIKDSIGRMQDSTFVNEDGLYDVILDSRKPEAKRFRKWITSDVLPSIRKKGSYSLSVPQSFSEALRLAADLQEEAERNKPKIEAHDRFISGDNYQTMAIVAKSLGIGRNNLFKLLKQKKVLMENNTPYQRYMDSGYFVVKEKPIKMGGQVINKPQTYVTPKGVSYLDKLLQQEVG